MQLQWALLPKQEGFAWLAAQTCSFPYKSGEGILNKEKEIKVKWKASLFTGTGALHLSSKNTVVLSSDNDSKIRLQQDDETKQQTDSVLHEATVLSALVLKQNTYS